MTADRLPVRRALLSVSDKTGLVELARDLVAHGVELVSTGGTRVDGVFTADPERDSAAQRFESIHGSEVLSRDLGVMDLTAITLAKQSGLPILVFNMNTPGTFARVLRGEPLGTTVHWDADAARTVLAPSPADAPAVEVLS